MFFSNAPKPLFLSNLINVTAIIYNGINVILEYMPTNV